MEVEGGQGISKRYTESPLSLYRALRSLHPSPYMYYYDLRDHHVVGPSPHILVRQEVPDAGAQPVTTRPPARTRLFPLSVAGAFHTAHMEPAVRHLAEVAAAMPTGTPSTALLSDLDGEVVTEGRAFADRLVHEVGHPVRWDLCMATMAERGVTGIMELTPAGTRTGIAKRNLKGVALFNLNTPDQLADARAVVEKHSTKTAEV